MDVVLKTSLSLRVSPLDHTGRLSYGGKEGCIRMYSELEWDGKRVFVVLCPCRRVGQRLTVVYHGPRLSVHNSVVQLATVLVV